VSTSNLIKRCADFYLDFVVDNLAISGSWILSLWPATKGEFRNGWRFISNFTYVWT